MQQQQINLYQPVSASSNEPFSVTMMLALVLLSVLLMLAFYSMLYVQKNNLKSDVMALQAQLEQTSSTVEKLERTISSVTDIKKEQQQLKRLKQVYTDKQKALHELSGMVQGNNQGMSDYFSALARKNIKAIWFSQIDIYSGGQQITLQGQTSDAKSIPPFVLSLKKEPAFSGVNFKLFNAQRNKDENSLKFILQTEGIQAD